MKHLKKLNFNLKKNFLNHLMISGGKKLCEKEILRSFKVFQKTVKKPHQNILKLAIINLAPIILLKKIKKKKRKTNKEFPFFFNKHNRISFAIKSILLNFKQKSKINLFIKLQQEILLTSQNKSGAIENKKTLQEYALTKKKYSYYRWFC